MKRINNFLKNRKKKNRICVIMLTYNRPYYIERSIESLYKRTGIEFDLFVFDDYSDKETRKKLKELKRKYKFNLFINKKRMGIFKSFYYNLKNISIDYDYYVKFDSDIEVLSDGFFKEMLEIYKYPAKIGCSTSRVEGIRNIDRYDTVIEFYAGHAIKKDAPVVYGCCLFFPKEVFLSFEHLTDDSIEKTSEKWGIDSLLYSHAMKFGKIIIVEDLSVYHIDNTYGQRRVDNMYFTERKRWSKIDSDEVWFMNVSKQISPAFIEREKYTEIKRISMNFKDFLKKCEKYVKDKSSLTDEIEEDVKIRRENIENKIKEDSKNKIFEENKKIIEVKKFKITSPLNYRREPHIEHGTFVLYDEIPKWAKDNPRLVIEEMLCNVEIEIDKQKVDE